MKACIVLQNQYSKIGHAIANVLKEQYGVTEFSAYVFSRGAEEFVRTQKEISYNPILVDHELHKNFKNEVIDNEYIKNFEKTYGLPQVWQHFYADRKLMMSIGPKEETTAVIDPLYSHEDFLRIFQVRAKAIEKMLEETRPDFIFFFAIGALGHLILYQVAKKMGIPTFNIDFPRIANRMCISRDFNTLTEVVDTFETFQKEKEKTEYHTEAKELIEHFRKTGSLRLQYMNVALGQLPKPIRILNPKHLIQSISYLFTLLQNYLKSRNLFEYGMTNLNPLRFIWYKIKQYGRAIRGLDRLYKPLNWDEDFAFFPLHYEPELAILLLSPYYFDQLTLIRYIAQSLPLHYKLYVKEHPAMVSKRQNWYYKELLKIPNVRLVNHRISSFEFIKRAKIITAITGTVGWEASIYGKPVITFGNVFYNALPFVKRVRSMEDLPSIIQDQLKKFKYNESAMVDFTAAVLKESVPFDFSNLWYENDINKLKKDPGLNTFCSLLMKTFRKHSTSYGKTPSAGVSEDQKS